MKAWILHWNRGQAKGLPYESGGRGLERWCTLPGSC